MPKKYQMPCVEFNMSEYDKKNLEFLMTVSPETLKMWMDTASDDDREYGLALLTSAKYDILDRIFDENPDVSLAAAYIDEIKNRSIT